MVSGPSPVGSVTVRDKEVVCCVLSSTTGGNVKRNRVCFGQLSVIKEGKAVVLKAERERSSLWRYRLVLNVLVQEASHAPFIVLPVAVSTFKGNFLLLQEFLLAYGSVVRP